MSAQPFKELFTGKITHLLQSITLSIRIASSLKELPVTKHDHLKKSSCQIFPHLLEFLFFFPSQSTKHNPLFVKRENLKSLAADVRGQRHEGWWKRKSSLGFEAAGVEYVIWVKCTCEFKMLSRQSSCNAGSRGKYLLFHSCCYVLTIIFLTDPPRCYLRMLACSH